MSSEFFKVLEVIILLTWLILQVLIKETYCLMIHCLKSFNSRILARTKSNFLFFDSAFVAHRRDFQLEHLP